MGGAAGRMRAPAGPPAGRCRARQRPAHQLTTATPPHPHPERYGDGRESMAFTFHCAAWSATCVKLANLGISWTMASTAPADGGVKLMPLLPPPPPPAPEGRMLILSTPGGGLCRDAGSAGSWLPWSGPCGGARGTQPRTPPFHSTPARRDPAPPPPTPHPPPPHPPTPPPPTQPSPTPSSWRRRCSRWACRTTASTSTRPRRRASTSRRRCGTPMARPSTRATPCECLRRCFSLVADAPCLGARPRHCPCPAASPSSPPGPSSPSPNTPFPQATQPRGAWRPQPGRGRDAVGLPAPRRRAQPQVPRVAAQRGLQHQHRRMRHERPAVAADRRGAAQRHGHRRRGAAVWVGPLAVSARGPGRARKAPARTHHALQPAAVWAVQLAGHPTASLTLPPPRTRPLSPPLPAAPVPSRSP
jgi:hypothetical protein